MSHRSTYQEASLRRARLALARAPRCGAKCKRTGLPCRAVAMANGRCRMHGGRSPGAPAGEEHWNYKHGQRAQTDEKLARRWLRNAQKRQGAGRVLAELLMVLKEAKRRGALPKDLPEHIRRLVEQLE